MLEKPDIPDQLIKDRVQDEYGYHLTEVGFLPLGYDVNTAVYRLLSEDQTAYFLKLRKGAFDEMTVVLPQFLKSQGVHAVISPIVNKEGRLWGNLQAYKMILYPYIQGKNGYQVALSGQHWLDLGVAVRGIHSAEVPQAFRALIQQEDYSPQWRESVRKFQALVENRAFTDLPAAKLADFMQGRRNEIRYLVERAGELSEALQARSLEFVLCHSDLHRGNLLVPDQDGSRGNELFIVDWDNPIFAPKERDLMFVGMNRATTGTREEALFYRGYNLGGSPGCIPGYRQGYRQDRGAGPLEVDQMALAYYRHERIVQDIAAFCEQLFLTAEGGEDREQAYQYFVSQFLPDHEVDTAIRTDRV